MNTPEHKKVRLVALRLKIGASAWWAQLEVNRQSFGKRPIRTWEKMERLMKERFFPPNYEQILHNQYQKCKQGRSIGGHIEKFHRLGALTNLAESEHHLIAEGCGWTSRRR